MISDIRAYFNEQILEVDPDLIAQDNDLFGNNDLNKALAAKYYNLIIGKNAPERDGNSHSDNIPVTLDVFTSETRDYVASFDALYEKGINIKNHLIDSKNYVGDTYRFNDLESISIEPIEELSNDNSFKVRLEFIVRNNFIIV